MILLTFHGLLDHIQELESKNKSIQIEVHTAIAVTDRV